jgi:hypothetical protein
MRQFTTPGDRFKELRLLSTKTYDVNDPTQSRKSHKKIEEYELGKDQHLLLDSERNLSSLLLQDGKREC